MEKQNWLNKPRKFDKFIRWIVFDPKALSVLMVMSYIMAFVVFLILFICAVLFWNTFLKILFFVGLVLTINNLYKYHRFQRKTGSIYVDTNMNDLIYGGKKR